MPTLAARLAVSVATASVVMTGIEAWRTRHPRVATPPSATDEPITEPTSSVPRLGQSQAAAAEPSPARLRVGSGAFAMARICGRVIGSRADLENLEIKIEDEVRAYQPRIDDDGTFEINLPVGSYTITAFAGDRIALVEVAGLEADEARQVVLALSEGVAIRGRVLGCAGPCEDVTVHVEGPGTLHEGDSVDTDEHGDFAAKGLIPGRGYDLTFEARGRRRLLMRGVAAPRQGLVVTLAPAASLKGGFGVAPGEECPMESAALDSGEDEEDRRTEFDRACRFHFDDLRHDDHVHLSADGEGWHFELDVPIPAQGDPPFLCLHPPCREPEPEVESSLEVLLDGPRHRPLFVRATILADRASASAACESGNGPCIVEGLRPSPDVKVFVHSPGCEPTTYTMNIGPGKNYLTSTCEGVREIQGVLRGTLGKDVVDHSFVRCSSQHPPRRVSGRFFDLQCPERLANIEYLLGESDTWQSAAITSEGDDSDGYVEITAG